MRKSSVIVIAGPPASGKTTLAKVIAAEFELPLLCKDDLKIQLYESLKGISQITDQNIAAASYDILFQMFRELVKARVNLVIESNFESQQGAARFTAVRQEIGFQSFTVVCNADLRVLHPRFVARDATCERHPSLVCEQYADFDRFSNRQLELKSDLFDIGDARMVYDTTNFDGNGRDTVMERVKQFLNPNPLP